MVYLNYYAQISKSIGKKINIARYIPQSLKEYIDYSMKTLAPSKELLQGYKEEKISKEEYVELYLKQLKSFNGKQAIQELIDMAREEDVTLLCYEKNGDFCHRFILGEYLEKIFDIEVKIIK